MLRLTYRGRSGQKNILMPGWALGLMAAGSAALGVALFLVISTLTLILLPVMLIGGGVAAFMMRRRIEKALSRAGFADIGGSKPGARRAPRRSSRPDIEDADYRVVNEPKEPPRAP